MQQSSYVGSGYDSRMGYERQQLRMQVGMGGREADGKSGTIDQVIEQRAWQLTQLSTQLNRTITQYTLLVGTK
jgi:hypothetical protein